MRKSSILVAAALALTACAGRPPAPVAIVQPSDRLLECPQITAEVSANDAKLIELGKESGRKVGQNVAAGVAGLFIPVLWFAMDFQDATGKDTAALQQRQSYLAALAVEKECGSRGR